ncbi:hypothetical protein CEXT_574411 [Caerostris extrusa]|uniref:Uncharacterized protein n=1 Tax=Caerostris extrusa TaxID=172846 RepID=A0AAV4XZI5_CAEEX|nr:hypothetical protein CEXT_574411 [Caerostris extrusa]
MLNIFNLYSNKQSSRIRFQTQICQHTGAAHIGFLLWSVLTARIRVRQPLWDLARYQCIPISAHTSNRMKHSVILKTPFSPIRPPAPLSPRIPAPRIEIHGGSAPRAVMHSDRTRNP